MGIDCARFPHWDKRRRGHGRWTCSVGSQLAGVSVAVGINYPVWLPHWDRKRCSHGNRLHPRELDAQGRFLIGPEGQRLWELITLRGCPIGIGGATAAGIDRTVRFPHWEQSIGRAVRVSHWPVVAVGINYPVWLPHLDRGRADDGNCSRGMVFPMQSGGTVSGLEPGLTVLALEG